MLCIKRIILLLFYLFTVNVLAKEFQATVLIQESSINKVILYETKEKINYDNNKINKKIKYKKILEQMIKKIIFIEQKYKNKEISFMTNIYDDKKNIWTITITTNNKGNSVSYFISKQSNKIINGWINRDNKDIFGFRLLNF